MSSSFSALKRCNFLPDASSSKKEDDSSDLNRPRVGMALDVKSFLSNNGKTRSLVQSDGKRVSFDVVRGKHLLICCVSLPLSSGSYYFHSMIDAYSELSRDDFEMVLVASCADKAVFDDFFSAVPCLAIPFSDVETRHYICSFIGLNLNYFCRKVSVILIDPMEIILRYRVTPELFVKYGSEWFPFLDSNVEAIKAQDQVLRFRLDPIHKKRFERSHIPEAVMGDPLLGEPLSLHRDILLCDPSLALPRIGRAGEAHQSLTVSELSNKYVGLYMCVERGFLGELVSVHQQCIANGQELEIVLVCIPLFMDIKSFQEELIRDLRRENITSWLVFPNHSKVWRRLWRVFSQECFTDGMIILPPNGKSGELEGKAVIEQIGITEYPFIRSRILERRFTALRSLTPASLFKGTSKKRTCLVRNGKRLNVCQSALEGKKLLVYLDWLRLSDDHGKLCCLLMKLYPKIKAMGWEVVFVPLDEKDRSRRHRKFSKMPWPIMPVRAAVEASVTRQLIFEGEYYRNQLIAFEKDGRIVSRKAKKGLKKHGVKDSLFSDKLYKEIAAPLVLLEDDD